MSRHQYTKQIGKELKKLNEIIDFKILHGLSYREETRKHKELLKEMKAANARKPSFKFLSFFF